MPQICVMVLIFSHVTSCLVAVLQNCFRSLLHRNQVMTERVFKAGYVLIIIILDIFLIKVHQDDILIKVFLLTRYILFRMIITCWRKLKNNEFWHRYDTKKGRLFSVTEIFRCNHTIGTSDEQVTVTGEPHSNQDIGTIQFN